MARLPLQTLPAFRAVARSQNLRAAAEELNLTHSAVSQQIKLLEEQIGFPLFDRRGRLRHHPLTTRGGNTRDENPYESGDAGKMHNSELRSENSEGNPNARTRTDLPFLLLTSRS